MGDAQILQSLAHHPGQGAYAGLGDVGHLEAGGIQLVPGAHAADHGHAGLVAAADQRDLRGNRIDAVRHIVVLRKIDAFGRVVVIEEGKRLKTAFRLNAQRALHHHIGLVATDGLPVRHQLSVDVGHVHDVRVHKIHRADARAHQCLSGEGAHAAHAKHDYAPVVKQAHGVRTDQPGGSFILSFHKIISPAHYDRWSGICQRIFRDRLTLSAVACRIEMKFFIFYKKRGF